MNEKIEELKIVTGICVLNLTTMADILNKLDMTEDAKQVSEMAMDACGHGRFAYHFLRDKFGLNETE